MDPAPLMRLATSYWEAQVFLTANRLRLFETLAPAPLSAPEIATALGLHPRPTQLFLNACVALGLLEAVGDTFRNSPVSSAFLVPGTPAYLGDAVRYSDALYPIWGQLEQALRLNRPPLSPTAYLGSDAEQTRHFVYGMHNRALGPGRALVDLVDLSGCHRLLDVGGGSGTYAALLTQRYPGLQAQVLDLPAVLAVARDILAAMGVGDRVTTVPGDYRTTAFPTGNDVVLLSGVLHRETSGTCRELIAKARDSLEPEGQLVVADVCTDAGGTSPMFATLFGLNMVLTSTEGGVHADADVVAWMQAAGFRRLAVRAFPPPMPHKVIVGTKG